MSTEATGYALVAEHLRKTYHYGPYVIPAADDVSFTLRPGAFVGIFGPNGAGKTTVTKLCVGLVRPEQGRVLVGGRNLASVPAEAKRLIGYLPQSSSLLASMTVAEELTFQARSFGLGRHQAARQAEWAAATLGVSDLLPRDVLRLSGGQRRRVELALAVVHRPAVLILDEPTLGLDPQSRAGLWDTIGRIRAESGTAILMTTHYLDEASDVLSDVIIMDHGRIVESGSSAAIVRQYAKGRVTLGPFDDAERVLRQLTARLAADNVDVAGDLDDTGSAIVLRTAVPERVLPVVIDVLRDLGVRVTEAATTPGTISDAFFAITGRAYSEIS
jgi:ABC-2 type transport system ATP-binding protein